MQINELLDKDINTEQLYFHEKLFYRNRWFCFGSLTHFAVPTDGKIARKIFLEIDAELILAF